MRSFAQLGEPLSERPGLSEVRVCHGRLEGKDLDDLNVRVLAVPVHRKQARAAGDGLAGHERAQRPPPGDGGS
jgi:hypothetical protein